MNRHLKMIVAGSEMTAYQIELEAGIPLTKLSRIIHGAIQPSEEEKDSIAGVLGVPVQDLFNPSSHVMA
ncbi:MAG: helix-turn-helix transcriptional regulator [Nitrospinae bacterium]|nr:helix-turn-helix transcriptional regulator [Nitrospinota bacterium]